MQVDVLITEGTSQKGRDFLRSVHSGAVRSGIDSRIARNFHRPGSWVVLYGLGGPDRVRFIKNPKVISFDIGYWGRKVSDRHYRVSIGGLHPPSWIFKGPRPGPERWHAAGLQVTQPKRLPEAIMVVGNGPKSNVIGAEGWTAAKSREIKAAFPGREIVYRPKPKRPLESGVVADRISLEPIEDALRTVGLVVCRHSNVAVDACMQGIPVVCDDGAAASVYPSRLTDYQLQPSADLREEFLHRLAWWQWTAGECASGQFWSWIKGIL